jgi:uncharacterized ion transporter superfamily protein YfcC
MPILAHSKLPLLQDEAQIVTQLFQAEINVACLFLFLFLFFQTTVIGRANLQKNRAEQKHYQQRSCSYQQNCNKPHKHIMVLHACKFFIVIFLFRAAQTQWYFKIFSNRLKH